MKKRKLGTTRTTIEHKAWISVVRAYNLCDVQLGQRLAELGLRIAEHEILANIHHTPGITQQELSRNCFVAKSGVSMTLGRMEAQEWLRRESDSADGRVKRLFLTRTGAALAEQGLAVQAGIIAHMMAPASDAELNELSDVAERIAERLA